MASIFQSGRRVARSSVRYSLPRTSYRAASRASIPIPPPFPVIESCPAPSCQCREVPAGLEIDRESPLNGTMAAYAEQILISTGRSDWKSKIEDDEQSDFLKQLKKFLGQKGKFSDVRIPL